MIWRKSDLKKLYETYGKLVDDIKKRIDSLEKDKHDIRDNIQATISKMTTYTSGEGSISELYYKKVEKIEERFQAIEKEIDTTVNTLYAKRRRAIDIRDQLFNWLKKEEEREKNYSLNEIHIQ